jgi:hypothetical protein
MRINVKVKTDNGIMIIERCYNVANAIMIANHRLECMGLPQTARPYNNKVAR